MKKITVELPLITALLSTGCSVLVSEGNGAPIGDSTRAGNYIATLLHTREPRLPTLSGDPENDRFRISLLLHSVDGGSRRNIPIANGLRFNDFSHNARFLGYDGRLLWFHAHEVAAYDFQSGNLLTGSNLPKTGEPHRPRLFDDSAPAKFQSRAKRFDADYPQASIVLKAASSEPLRLSAPDSVLITHRSTPGYPWTYTLSRVLESGKAIWTVDTGLEHLEQILPDPRVIAFIGKNRPKDPLKPEGPMLVLINNESGASSRHSLWVGR